MAKEVVIGRRLYDWDGPGKAGVVTDKHFIRCFWPRFSEPTRIFAEGSSGIVVQGPPTPRNIIFPDDTSFPEVDVDADNMAWEAFIATGKGRGYAGNDPAQIKAYTQTYTKEKEKSPPTAAKIKCRHDCCFIAHQDPVTKERFVAPITHEEAKKYCDNKVDKAAFAASKDYCKIDDAGNKLYRRNGAGFTEKVEGKVK